MPQTSHAPANTDLAFLAGGGEMGSLLRAHDWSGSSLGEPSRWPQALRTAVRLILNCGHPMFIFWGPDGACFYNDAYRQSIGSERHPGALGRPAREVWEEIWHVIGPQISQVMSGRGATWHENALVPITRNGRREDVYWTYSYSPLDDDTAPSGIGGVLVVTSETTQAVLANQQSEAARERQLLLLKQMPGFVGVLRGPEHVYEYVNDAYITISGQRNFIGRPVRDVFPELKDQGFYELLDQVYATGERYVAQGMPIRLTSETTDRFIDFVYEPIRDLPGRVTGIFVGGYDVTEVHRAAAALQELNADLERQVLERSHVGGRTWLVSPDLLGALNSEGHFESPNPAWQQVLGWSEAEVASMSIWDLLHPDDVERTRGGFQLTQEGQPAIGFPNRYRRKDGSYCWISWVGVPVGGLVYCSGRDISQDKATEAERDQLWALSEDMLARADYNGGMSAVSPAWTEVLGWSEQELLTNPYADIIHPDNVPETVAALLEMRRTGQPTRFENKILAKDGEWKPIGWTVSPEPDGVNFIAVGRDLKEYKIRERELMDAQEALRQSQKMEAVGQLTGGIAHDFNNLLGGISGSLELLEKRLAEGRIAGTERYIASAQDASRRAAALTQRLLAFSRRQTLDPKPIDANRLVASLEDLIRRTMGPNVHVDVAGVSGLWTTRVDPSQLENALLNLCINARDAMAPDGGRLTIDTANLLLDQQDAREHKLAPGEYVSLRVTDTGTGMTPDVIERAFDPFFTTKPLGQGTGLGLSMIYGFVRQSGGHVRILSEVGKGTTMCLFLPRHIGSPEEAAADPAPAQTVGSIDGETVLVIDDEPILRMLVVDVLQENGYKSLEAADGASGLEILQSDARIDLLITDVGLPGGMNGRQVADAARKVRPDLKVLFITGYAQNAVVGNGHLDPGMEVLTKPFPIATLGDRIRDLIAR